MLKETKFLQSIFFTVYRHGTENVDENYLTCSYLANTSDTLDTWELALIFTVCLDNIKITFYE
jgi:hypothetical protein